MSSTTVMRIVIIESDGRSKVYPEGRVDFDATASTITRDIVELMHLNGNYDIYVRLTPDVRLSSLGSEKVSGIAILPKDVQPTRSVELG